MIAATSRVLKRNSYLDFLRAWAVVLVVAYHVIQMCPQPLLGLMKFARYGQYGVDLFFVLSGWLIGGLYWNEKARFGNVKIVKFWLRRWLRTIPPYWAALTLSWLAVFIHSRKPFDYGYLAFIQNYYSEIPYFLVSWSLCIEEHFYLFLPLLLALKVQSGKAVSGIFALLVMIAPVSRWMLSLDGLEPVFGFEHTATHLRMEGLLLGFWLAHELVFAPQRWGCLKALAPWIGAVAFGVFIAVQYMDSVWMYRVGLTALSLGLAMLLVALVERKAGRFASSRLVNGVAQASFSIYLVHPLMIHAARGLLGRFSWIPWWGYFPVVFGLIMGAGALFYFCVERTSILLRDGWVPRRIS